MNGTVILLIIVIYFAFLMLISHLTGRKSDNDTFFLGGKQSPWFLVAFGMIGTSISGVTFVSVPGMPLSIDMTYLQTVLGFTVGYLVIAKILLPLYYKLNLTSIYTYLEKRFGRNAYKTGASFFLLSKIIGAAARLYIVVLILQRFVRCMECAFCRYIDCDRCAYLALFPQKRNKDDCLDGCSANSFFIGSFSVDNLAVDR